MVDDLIFLHSISALKQNSQAKSQTGLTSKFTEMGDLRLTNSFIFFLLEFWSWRDKLKFHPSNLIHALMTTTSALSGAFQRGYTHRRKSRANALQDAEFCHNSFVRLIHRSSLLSFKFLMFNQIFTPKNSILQVSRFVKFCIFV